MIIARYIQSPSNSRLIDDVHWKHRALFNSRRTTTAWRILKNTMTYFHSSSVVFFFFIRGNKKSQRRRIHAAMSLMWSFSSLSASSRDLNSFNFLRLVDQSGLRNASTVKTLNTLFLWSGNAWCTHCRL